MTQQQPGRYQRSPSGLIGAMLVVLVLIGAFLALRACSRETQPTSVQTVDYIGVMEQARNDGEMVAPAPDPLPKGWHATSVRYVPGDRSSWHLGLLTAVGKYVGIEEARLTPREMVDKYLGKDAKKAGPARIRSRTWQTWTQASGDYAVTFKARHETLLVGGSAREAVILDLTDALALPRLDR